MYSLSDYDYHLPSDLIAQHPAVNREESRLLHITRDTGSLSHYFFFNIIDLLRFSDVLVVNNTEVIPARLFGRKETGGKVEVLLLNYADGISKQNDSLSFECRCLIRASKGPKTGAKLIFDKGLTAEIIDVHDSTYTIRFSSDEPFETILYQLGHVPLPPYIKRDGNHSTNDSRFYQTVYASMKGAVAAPTAGLHFSEKLLEQIKSKGVKIVPITLHVSYGTFLPIRVTDIRDHEMHAEWYSLPEDTAAVINNAKANNGRIIAVGTTSVRTLEFTSDSQGKVKPGSGSCDMFIYPGYSYKTVDAIITNFHLPKSTLLMLVSAFAGRENILHAYEEAVREKYRFYSYGDAMLIA